MDKEQLTLAFETAGPAEDPAARPTDLWLTAPKEAFATWLTAVKSKRGNLHYSPVSIRQYCSMWGQFCFYLSGETLTLKNVDSVKIHAFLTHRPGPIGPALSRSTISRYLALFNQVFEELYRLELRHDNPVAPLLEANKTPLAPPTPAHLSHSLDEQFIDRVQQLPEGTWREARDKTLLLMLPGSGLTQAEILALETRHLFIDEAVPYVLVPEHGRKPARAVSLSPFAVEALKNWREKRKLLEIAAAEVFPAQRQGGTLNPSTLYRHVCKILDELGVARQKGARRLRHTFALRQLRNGAPAAAVRDWLGLETDEMIDRYKKLVPNRHGVTAV